MSTIFSSGLPLNKPDPPDSRSLFLNTESFDAAKFLEDEETIAAYLNMAREDPNPEMLRRATENVYRAQDVTLAAKSIQN